MESQGIGEDGWKERAIPVRLINSGLFLTGHAFPPEQGITEQGLNCHPDSGFFLTPDKPLCGLHVKALKWSQLRQKNMATIFSRIPLNPDGGACSKSLLF